MSWGARQWLRFTPESAYGQYDNSQTPLWIRMDRDQFFTMRPKPLLGVIRSGDAGNRRIQAWRNMTMYSGGIATPCYPSQVGVLVAWWLHLVSSGTDFDLGSMTIDHFDTKQSRRYLGCKAGKGTLSVSQAGDNGKASLLMEIVAQTLGTPDASFVEPPLSAYPAENPYLFGHTTQHLSVGGIRSKYKAFELSVSNMLDATVDELPYISSLVYCGRDIDWGFTTQYQSTNDRTAYENATLQAGAVQFVKDQNNSMLLTLNNANLIAGVDDEMAMNKATYQKISLQNMVDGGAGTDITGSFIFAGGTALTF